MKTEIKTKIKLFYDSKYKSNGKVRQIRMKTRNLTQSHTRNDPINYRFKAFYSTILKMKFGIQDVIPFDSFNQFLISNTCGRRNESRRVKNQMILRLWCLNSSVCSKWKNSLSVEEHFNFIGKFGLDHWMR